MDYPVETAEGFARLLLSLAGEGLAHVVVVIRSDAYPRLQGSPALLELRDKGATYDLTPPTPDEVDEITRLPVAASRRRSPATTRETGRWRLRKRRPTPRPASRRGAQS